LPRKRKTGRTPRRERRIRYSPRGNKVELKVQKRLAAQVLKCSPKKIVFDTTRLSDIKEAITKADIRGLIRDRAIIAKPARGVSRHRARDRQEKRANGQMRGYGKRKGKATARLPHKVSWMAKIRTQRAFIRELREKKLIENIDFRMLYLKTKSGFFRSRRHIKLYLEEHNLVKRK
jgi:large subunit ribosomal protein L19e